MYRNKSSVSLRTLAYSLKQSINLDRHKAHSKEFVPLRSSASTVNFATYKNAKRNNNEEDYLIMLETRKSKFSGLDKINRDSNYSELKYDLKSKDLK